MEDSLRQFVTLKRRVEIFTEKERVLVKKRRRRRRRDGRKRIRRRDGRKIQFITRGGKFHQQKVSEKTQMVKKLSYFKS